jgi:hypothetical protein
MTQSTTVTIPALIPAYYDRLLLDNLYFYGSVQE